MLNKNTLEPLADHVKTTGLNIKKDRFGILTSNKPSPKK